MSFINKLAGLAAVTVSVLALTGATLAADYNWTFQTSETAGEPGFINKQKWAENVGVLSGGRISIEILPIGSVVPHTDTLEAVGSGILQGHMTDPSYFAGKDPAFAMMGNLVGAWSDPFELLGFMQSGGGDELYSELVEPYGVHFIGAAATEPEAFVSSVPIRTVEDLKGVARRVIEHDHLVDSAIGKFSRRRLLVRSALDVQSTSDLLEPSGVRGFPARLEQPVMIAGNDHQPRRKLIHPEVEGAVRACSGYRGPFDHAENLQPVLPPRRYVGGFETQVAQRPDAHDCAPFDPPRKSAVSLLNSSNFSSCAQ